MSDHNLIIFLLFYFIFLFSMVIRMKNTTIALSKERMLKEYINAKELAIINVRNTPKNLDLVINSQKRYKAAGYF